MIKVTKLTENLNKKQKNLLLRIIAAAVMLVILFILPLDDYPIVRFLLFLIPYFTVGYDILRKAFKGILNHQVFDECFLMAVATIGAMILGEYTEGVAVMLFYQVGELFQSIAVGKSRRSISDLMDIRPDYANLEQDGEVEKVDPDEVEVSSIIVIRPGEKVPIDGIVVEGNSSLNTSALTGESLPRDVKPGDEIISGSVNMSGLLRVETTKEFDESTASKILELVENAGERKAKSEQFITKFARWYTPAVCYSALALAILGPVINVLAFHKASDWALWSDWIYRALQGAHLPGHQLPLRDRSQCSAVLLRRDRRREQRGNPDQGFQFHGDPGQCQIPGHGQDRNHYQRQFRGYGGPRWAGPKHRLSRNLRTRRIGRVPLLTPHSLEHPARV